MISVLAALADGPSYTISFPERRQNLVDVEATVPAAGPTTTLFMPIWTPGSYLVREYAQHVEDLTATGPDGAALAVRKTTKNRWEVDTGGLDSFTLRYRLFARAMAVQGNFADAEFAVLNGAPTFIAPVDREGPYAITVVRPDDWSTTVSPLGEGDRFVAPTYDLLIDSPLVVGNPAISAFEVGGVPHLLVDVPPVAPWDSAKAADGARRVVERMEAFWGSFPYERYVFVNVLGEAGGGLEHLASTHMITSRFNTAKDEAFQGWLGLVAHEHFHAWNVKRLRPEGLGPFDYEREVHTPSLWVAEGFTSYYDDVLLARAGLIDEAEYLKRLAKNLDSLQSTPGRSHQPVDRSSHDAWIELYRRDEHSANSAISYYTKGAVIAWVLDARIRAATAGKRSLDDAMRTLYARHSGERGYRPEDLVAAFSETAGEDLGPLVDRLTRTTEEIPYDEALSWFGLRFEGAEPKDDEAWLGLTVSGDRVTGVRRGSPAWDAGINVDDEVLAIGGDRVSGASVERRKPGERVEVLVARRGRILTLTAELAAKPGALSVAVDDAAGKPEEKRRAAWIGPAPGVVVESTEKAGKVKK